MKNRRLWLAIAGLAVVCVLSCGTNGAVSGSWSARANGSTNVAATLVLSSHNTTKAHATMTRVN